MTDLDHDLLRRLADWDGTEVPISSLYLTVDGRRFPRKADYEIRLDELLRRAHAQAQAMAERPRRSVDGDILAMSEFVRGGFERGETRGLALFSSHAAGRWEAVLVPRPVRDRAVVGARADLMPLEVLLETYRPTGVALVDFEKARLFLVELGRIDEVTDVWDEVPGRHDQGGWAQMRMQRHVDDHRAQHLKHVAEALFTVFRRRPFEHLVLAGPAEARHELEASLHDYLARRVRARLTMAIGVPSAEVLARVLEVEESAEREREREAIERLARAAAVDDQGAAGLEPTLEALAAARVAQLVVSIDLSAPGAACSECGRLIASDGPCPACGGKTQRIPDVVDAAVAAALRTGSRVETVSGGGLDELGGIGALLRF
jgi:peptide chain release factor subunit 1